MPKQVQNTNGPRSRITRVLLKNYKSIESCDVALYPLTFLLGPNGAGKSNFLDALRFVSDSLRTTLENALRDRGGIREVRLHSRGHPTHFEVQLELVLKDVARATYGFRVGAKEGGAFTVQWEKCRVWSTKDIKEPASYEVREGQLHTSSPKLTAAVEPDRLYLTAVSGSQPFRLVYDALTSMGFYNLNPDLMKDLQSPDAGEILQRDGSNLASILSRVDSASLKRICEYLAVVVPGVRGVEPKTLGHKVTFEILQEVAGDENPWRFPAVTVSDGTLRALGILVALYQRTFDARRPMTTVGIEEPETALHPGAAVALSDALIEASRGVQVLSTSHSPELLDNEHIPVEGLLAVVSEKGRTRIAPVDASVRTALADRLYTTGELLKSGQIQPDPDELKKKQQTTLFSKENTS